MVVVEQAGGGAQVRGQGGKGAVGSLRIRGRRRRPGEPCLFLCLSAMSMRQAGSLDSGSTEHQWEHGRRPGDRGFDGLGPQGAMPGAGWKPAPVQREGHGGFAWFLRLPSPRYRVLPAAERGESTGRSTACADSALVPLGQPLQPAVAPAAPPPWRHAGPSVGARPGTRRYQNSRGRHSALSSSHLAQGHGKDELQDAVRAVELLGLLRPTHSANCRGRWWFLLMGTMFTVSLL